MKKNWDKTLELIKEFEEKMSEFFNDSGLNLSISSSKKAFLLQKFWNNGVIKQINIFDKFISPVSEIKVKLPTGVTDEFLNKWQEYYEYMQEQFGITMQSRMIQYRMKAVWEYAGKDSNEAIKLLEFYMRGYPTIFPLNKTANNNETSEKLNIESEYDWNKRN